MGRDAQSASGMTGGIVISGLAKTYGQGREAVRALETCDLSIAPGEFVAIVGPSGCGKSTLINILAGFDAPSAGEIFLDGRLLTSAKAPASPGPDRVVVFQHAALFPWMTVMDNVTYGPRRQYRIGHDEARRKVQGLLQECGLDEIVDLYPGQISSGAQRRVELVRALVNDPAVLILDEPFRAMDSATKARMHDHVLRLHHLIPKTVIFVTHDLQEALLLADRVVVMTSRPGRIKLETRVDLPRPRNREAIATPAFLALKQRTHEAVHEEARKAFEAGERELA